MAAPFVPDTSNAVPLTSQVGGHAGVLSSADGSVIVKPALPAEKAFYEKFNHAENTDDSGKAASGAFEPLRPWLPKYYGTVKVPVPATDMAPATEKDELHYRQNVSHPFTKPNILDVKLGTVLYDAGASEEKKARMIKTAKETTSLETGVRLTGFEVYNPTTDSYDNTPKSYGKSIQVSQLPEGIARFFPVSADGSAGVKAALLDPVLDGILSLVKDIRSAVALTEMRMVGGSVLIVWEGKESALEEALNGGSAPAFAVRMIDFAHTLDATGQGADEGVVKGIDTVISLIEGRRKEIAGS